MKRSMTLISLLLATLTGCPTAAQLDEHYEEIDSDLDGVINSVDCAPTAPSAPGASGRSWFLDGDGDGHGDPSSRVDACDPPADGADWVLSGDDCNDADADVFETVTGFRDQDGDGFGRGFFLVTLCDQGDRLAELPGDCEDEDPSVYPGAEAVCGNGLDDDCDGLADCDPPEGQQSAADADALWSGEGEQALGATVAVPGDVDGDGFEDVVVGAPDGRGAAYVIMGPFDGAGDMDRAASARLVGSEGSAAGSALAGAGDVDGDGYDDFLVGAPGGLGGLAVLVYGPMRAVAEAGDEAELSTVSMDMVELRLNVDDAMEAGAALAAPGDLRGNDGVSDLVVAAPGAGAIYVVRGPVNSDVSLGDDGGVQVISGPTTLDLGRGLSTVGDLDGDGRAELAVGAPGYNDSMMGSFRGEEGAGAVYLFFETGNLVVDDADCVIYGEEDEARFGSVLADGGDIDGDGLGDLGVAAPEADGSSGTVWLFSGALLGSEAAPGLEEAEASLTRTASRT